jgi:hypothetical protein
MSSIDYEETKVSQVYMNFWLLYYTLVYYPLIYP